MQRATVVAAVFALLFAGSAAAEGIDLGDPTFSAQDLANLSDALADTISFPLLGSASSGGLVAFDLLAAVGGPKVDTGDHWWQASVDGSAVGGVLSGYRLVARKGLPLRLGIGAQGGEVLGQRFWGAEARWALLEGGALEPAACVRVTYSRLERGPLEVEVKEAQLAVSKGFTLLTPFVALGFRRVESAGYFGDPTPLLNRYDDDRVTGEAGVRFNLPPLRFVAEVRQGASRAYFVGFGLGL